MIPETPLHSLTSADHAAELPPVPDLSKNFVDHPDSLKYVMDEIVSLLEQVRTDNQTIRDEWHDIDRMSQMQHDSNQTYKGMSNAYLPVYSNAVNSRVRHVSQALFPTEDYIGVSELLDAPPAPLPNGMPPPGVSGQADVMKAWMQYQMEKQARIRLTIKPFLRQLYNYGISVGRVSYHKPLRAKPTGRMNINRMPLPNVQGSRLPSWDGDYAKRNEGGRFQAVNMMRFHMWPPSVTDIRQATLVFEDVQVNATYVREVGRAQGWKNIDVALSPNQPGNISSDLQQTQDAVRGVSTTAIDLTRFGDPAHWVILTEAWFNMPLPRGLLAPNEDPDSYYPVRALFAGTTPLLLTRNPYFFQHAPYVVRRLDELPDSFYGTGMGRAAKGLQYLANDFMNQTNDNGTYGLNPVAIVNPNMLVAPLDALKPGRVWSTTDVNSIKFDRPPVEQLQYGLSLVNWVVAQLNDMVGSPPIMQGTNSKGAAKTATGAQILQSNVSTDMQDEVRELELDVLIPTMEMLHILGQQFQDTDLMIATSGGSVRVKPADLVGQFNFSWLASSQLQSKQMRAQQAIQLLQVVASQMQLLAAQGIMFDPVPLIMRIAQEGLGFRDAASWFKSAPPPPGPGSGPGVQTGAGPGQQGPVSAMPQAAGGGDMTQGEGAELGDVRENANGISAAAGAMQNQG